MARNEGLDQGGMVCLSTKLAVGVTALRCCTCIGVTWLPDIICVGARLSSTGSTGILVITALACEECIVSASMLGRAYNAVVIRGSEVT